MIRFSAFLVVVAVGLLIAGVVTSKLLLVYIAIGVSGAALLALGIGAAVNWRELTGEPKTAAAETSEQGPVAQPAGPAPAPQAPAPQAPAPQVVPSLAASPPKPPVTAAAGVAPAGSGWPATAPSGPSRAGYLPTEQPLRAQPPRAPSPFQPAAAAHAPGRRQVGPGPASPGRVRAAPGTGACRACPARRNARPVPRPGRRRIPDGRRTQAAGEGSAGRQ